MTRSACGAPQRRTGSRATRTVIVLSCGALLDNFDLVELARRQGGRILVPT